MSKVTVFLLIPKLTVICGSVDCVTKKTWFSKVDFMSRLQDNACTFFLDCFCNFPSDSKWDLNLPLHKVTARKSSSSNWITAIRRSLKILFEWTTIFEDSFWLFLFRFCANVSLNSIRKLWRKIVWMKMSIRHSQSWRRGPMVEVIMILKHLASFVLHEELREK